MDPTEEAFVAQVREASIAQVDTRKAINSCLTQRASRDARRQLNPRRESARRREKIAICMESRMFDFGNNVNVAWCLCGYCVPMSTHIEFVCCLEKAGLLDRADRCLHELCQ